MKKFLLSGIKSLVYILFIFLCVDFVISYRLHKSTDWKFAVWNDILNDSINSDVLILGSSRAYQHYSPHILDSILEINCYNLGMSGAGINRQIMRYEFYKYYNKKPKYIIQNIDFYMTLCCTNEVEQQQYFPYLYHPKFREIVADEQMLSFAEKYIPFFRYYGFLDILESSSIQKLYKGYIGIDNRYFSYSLRGIDFNNYDSFCFNYEEEAEKMFCDFVSQVKKDSINLIFVYSPFYIDMINKVNDLDVAYFVFDSIAQFYNVPILDYTFSSIAYDTTYFSNVNHMNKRGAELFSTMLANDLDSLGIIK